MKKRPFLILAFAIACAGCAGSGSDSSSSGPALPATVLMTGSHSFNPTNVSVAAGSSVEWKNSDVFPHTVASDTGLANFNSDPTFAGGLPGGSTFTWTVPSGTPSGTVLFYHCEFHGAKGDGTHLGSGMAGSITVK
jgi:plastocyanin